MEEIKEENHSRINPNASELIIEVTEKQVHEISISADHSSKKSFGEGNSGEVEQESTIIMGLYSPKKEDMEFEITAIK